MSYHLSKRAIVNAMKEGIIESAPKITAPLSKGDVLATDIINLIDMINKIDELDARLTEEAKHER